MKKYCIVSITIISSILLSSCGFNSDDSSNDTPTSSSNPGIQRLDNDDSNDDSFNTNSSDKSVDSSDNDLNQDDVDDDSVNNGLSSDLSDKDNIKQVFDKWVQFDKEPLTSKEVKNDDIKYFIKINNRAMRDNKTIGNYAKKLSREQRTRLWKVPKIIGLYDLVQFDYSNPEQLTIVAHSLAKKDKLYYKQQSSVSKRTIDRDVESDISIKISDISIDGDNAVISDDSLVKTHDNLKTYVNSFKKKNGNWKVFMNDDYTHIVNKYPVTMGYDPEYESPEVKVPGRDTDYYPDMSNDTDN